MVMCDTKAACAEAEQRVRASPRTAGTGAASGQDETGRPELRTAGLRLPRLPPAQADERHHLGEGAPSRLLPPALAVSTQHAECAATREEPNRSKSERMKDVRVLIRELNPILRGWGSHFRTGNAARKFNQLDTVRVEAAASASW